MSGGSTQSSSRRPLIQTYVMPASKPMLHLGGAVCAMAALLAAGVATVALDALAPGAGPLVQPLSSFAHTDYAGLWHLAVGTGAAGLLLLAWTLRRVASTAFAIALAAAGVGLAVVGVCPADPWFPWERSPTFNGGLHLGAVVLVMVALSVAIAIRSHSVSLQKGEPWCRVSEVAFWCAVLGGVAYLGVGAAADRSPHLFGLWERLILGSAWTWCVLIAVGALRLHTDDPI